MFLDIAESRGLPREVTVIFMALVKCRNRELVRERPVFDSDLSLIAELRRLFHKVHPSARIVLNESASLYIRKFVKR